MMLVVLIGAASVLLFDTVGSLASRRFSFNYASLSPGSYLIRAGAGYFAEPYGGLEMSGLAGGIVAFVEATLGWYISWIIGPGRVKPEPTKQTIVYVILVVSLKGVGFGLGGGLFGRIF
jgi:hypothetical protein